MSQAPVYTYLYPITRMDSEHVAVVHRSTPFHPYDEDGIMEFYGQIIPPQMRERLILAYIKDNTIDVPGYIPTTLMAHPERPYTYATIMFDRNRYAGLTPSTRFPNTFFVNVRVW